MKSTWFGDRRRYDFARLIHEADRGKHSYETLRLFLEAASGALRQGAHKLLTGRMSDSIEESVIKAQKSVQHPQKFTEAMGVLVEALEEKSYDFIGTTMSELELVDKDFRGQCFTPPEICQLMARMTVGECQPDPDHRFTIDEPACGGGAMMIAVANVMRERGFLPWQYWMRGTDVDWRCFAITYIQLTLLGVPAQVIHGNTLTVQMFDSALTFVGAMHPLRDSRREPQREPHQDPQPIGELVAEVLVDKGVPVDRILPSLTDPAVRKQLVLFDEAG